MKQDRETRQIQGKGQDRRGQRETTPYYEMSTSEGQEKRDRDRGKDEDDEWMVIIIKNNLLVIAKIQSQSEFLWCCRLVLATPLGC